MNQRYLAFGVILASVLIGMLVFSWNAKETRLTNLLIEAQGGTCYLEDGTCLHDDRDYTLVILGGILSGLLLVIGLYLLVFDHNQKTLAKHQQTVTTALERAAQQEKEKDEFSAYLSGFDPDEQKVLKAVKEQEGIKQATLRYRTGLSKTALSLMLTDLEKRHIISRKVAGKTKEVYLQKRF